MVKNFSGRGSSRQDLLSSRTRILSLADFYGFVDGGGARIAAVDFELGWGEISARQRGELEAGRACRDR